MKKMFCDVKVKLFLYYKIANIKGSLFAAIAKTFKQLAFSKFCTVGKKNDFIFIKPSVAREDHHKFFSDIYNQCIFNKSFVSIERKKGLNLKKMWCVLYYLPHTFELRKIEKTDGSYYFSSFLVIILMYLQLIELQSIKRCVDTFDFSKVKAAIVLCDVLDYERIFVESANERGVLTITLQHAMFPPNIDEESFNVLNYWKATAKLAIVWGERTKILFNNYSPGIKIKICGNLSISYSHIEKVDEAIIGIAMDIPAYKDYNKKMIKIAEGYARRHEKYIRIRLHPTDSEDNYDIDHELCEFCKNIDTAIFIMAHTTTMIYTYMGQGKIVFRFRSDIPFYEIDNRICFDSVDSLEVCLNNYLDVDYGLIFREQIAYIGKESEIMYKRVFESIAKGDILRSSKLVK